MRALARFAGANGEPPDFNAVAWLFSVAYGSSTNHRAIALSLILAWAHRTRLAMSVLILAAGALVVNAGQPQLHALKVTWDSYNIGPGYSNGVVVLYKSTSLGTVFTPYKPTAYWPSTRTNGTISVLPGTYHFYATTQAQPKSESVPSNYCTNIVAQ